MKTKNYKLKYSILSYGVIEIVKNMKNDIYNGKLSPNALKYMSDLKYYLINSYYKEKGIKVKVKKINNSVKRTS